MSDSEVIVRPVNEQLTLDEVREHLHVDVDDNHDYSEHDPWLLRVAIPGARVWCEGYLGLSLAPQTREYYADGFYTPLVLPYGPVWEVSSVRYADVDGVMQTLSVADYVAYRGAIQPLVTWPLYRRQPGAVIVRYRAGYDLPGQSPTGQQLPDGIRVGMLLVIGHLFENRSQTTEVRIEDVPMTMSIRSFLDQYRQRTSMA